MKKKGYSTGCSQVVSYPSTRPAVRCLTSLIGREAVFSSTNGRIRENGHSSFLFVSHFHSIRMSIPIILSLKKKRKRNKQTNKQSINQSIKEWKIETLPFTHSHIHSHSFHWIFSIVFFSSFDRKECDNCLFVCLLSLSEWGKRSLFQKESKSMHCKWIILERDLFEEREREKEGRGNGIIDWFYVGIVWWDCVISSLSFNFKTIHPLFDSIRFFRSFECWMRFKTCSAMQCIAMNRFFFWIHNSRGHWMVLTSPPPPPRPLWLSNCPLLQDKRSCCCCWCFNIWFKLHRWGDSFNVIHWISHDAMEQSYLSRLDFSSLHFHWLCL